METQVQTIGAAHWIQTPEQAMELQGRSDASVRGRPSLKTVMDEFGELLKDNPKVWAVYASEAPSGITVWTYVASDDRRDRSPVYAAEWQLLSRYPEIAFDFNVSLSPVGSEEFEAGGVDYLYQR